MVEKTPAVQELKKKKKKWIPIFASKEFHNEQVGETYLEEAEQCMNRIIDTNLMMLTRDSKKQNFNVKLKITEVKNNQANTELVGYSMQVAQLKRITKKGRNKVDDSFKYKTKDNIEMWIKPILLTPALTYKTSLKELRMVTRAFLTGYVTKNTFSDIMRDIISGNLQREIKANSKKSHPIVSCIIKEACRAQ